MTRKLKDLEFFIEWLEASGYKYEVPMNVLEKEIAREFGTSQYILKGVMEELVKFKLILPTTSPAIYRLGKLEKKAKTSKNPKKEADDFLDKFGDDSL